MNKKGPQILLIILSLVASVFLAHLSDENIQNKKLSVLAEAEQEPSVVDQQTIKTLDQPVKRYKLYNENKLIGIIHDYQFIETLLSTVYEKEYAEAFPETQLGFIDDVYVVDYLTYADYEDKDDEIFNYVYQEELIAISVPKVEFSNGATIFVKNVSDFNNARETFVKSYVSDKAYEKLKNNEKIESIKNYGEQDIGLKVEESIVFSEGFASIDNIYLDETEILNFLSFGKDPEYKTYKVKEYDMIEGIAVKNRLTVNQLISINHETITDNQQILKPGTKLNVTEFNSPFSVFVTKERKVEEIVHPDEVVYQKDPSLREGLTRVEVTEAVGYRDAVYEDVYLNDRSIDSQLVKATITKEPVRGLVKVGTYVEPKIGNGTFAWPMYNASIMCGWYCYAGHAAVDVTSRSNGGYGPIYASDRGVVSLTGYDGSRGYHITINHNNGYTTHYYHMNGPAHTPRGMTVRKGEQIGYVGMTGRTTAPHVHFEIRYNGVKQNPCRFIGC
ncbi:MAG TPA: peptidoglycan DD-metalloendopeptidase family protein [Erysipelothrix sp.]|nr:peptidoglycan DD-metalloendopeptidase family protein [Erysipelothrix sp.]